MLATLRAYIFPRRAFDAEKLNERIARIASPPVDELALKRAAKFGRLNVVPSFDLTAHVARSEARADVRARFAALVAGGR